MPNSKHQRQLLRSLTIRLIRRFGALAVRYFCLCDVDFIQGHLRR